MYESLFNATTLPVLQQVVSFTQARHQVLASNIANLDVPGYRARDLPVSEFQRQLAEAIRQRDEPPAFRSPGEPETTLPSRRLEPVELEDLPETILYHDDGTKGLEYQVSEMLKNQMQHNMAVSLMTHQFNLLRAAINERT
ncbi:MAG TPA: flagellar basal body rod protein FlgB [Thermoguttaceae bacterium]|nr:flagellar basal body rod protein FlgB [Thermoguttaceae bacterium]HPP51307.1 flagellar basal body rod protein FlgB [Thermoguttaceae bacterium]